MCLHVTDEIRLLRTADGRHLPLPPLDDGESFYDRKEKQTLRRTGNEYQVEDDAGLVQIFAGTQSKKSIDTNARILRNEGVPASQVAELRTAAVDHAKSLGLL